MGGLNDRQKESDRRSSTSKRTGGVAARADVITFEGHRYRGVSLRTHPPFDRIGSVPISHLQEIGTATRKPGRDTNHSRVESATQVQVASIAGVSPEIAIAGIPRGNVYLREGSELPHILTSAPWIQWRMSS